MYIVLWSKPSNYQEKLSCHAHDGRTDGGGKWKIVQYSGRPEAAIKKKSNFYFMVVMDILRTFLSSKICKVYFCLSAICWALKLLVVMRPLYKFHYTPDTSLQLLNTFSGEQANKRKKKWGNRFLTMIGPESDHIYHICQ